jgi:hypothetical protein
MLARCRFIFALRGGGKSTINGAGGKKLSNFGFGLTFGYQINDNLNRTVGYKSPFAQAAARTRASIPA